jgi:hypothetical protein
MAGPVMNELTDAGHGDPLTATPCDKHLRVRLRPAAQSPARAPSE